MTSFIGMGHSPLTAYDKHKHRDGPPQEMNIPKGYKSPFVKAEIALNELWMGQRNFLRQFHVVPKKNTFTQLREDNRSDGEFNPDTKR